MKRIGIDFLRTHPSTERMLGVDNNHSIVDNDELEKIYHFFNINPELLDALDKRLSVTDMNNKLRKNKLNTL